MLLAFRTYASMAFDKHGAHCIRANDGESRPENACFMALPMANAYALACDAGR